MGVADKKFRTLAAGDPVKLDYFIKLWRCYTAADNLANFLIKYPTPESRATSCFEFTWLEEPTRGTFLTFLQCRQAPTLFTTS